MLEGAFYQPKKSSPTTLAVVVLLHGAALTALAMAKMDNPGRLIFGRTEVSLIPLPKDPAEVPPEPLKQKVQPRQDTVIDRPDQIIKTAADSAFVEWKPLPPVERFVIPEPGPITVPKVEPAPKARTVEPARAKANLASYVSDEDYPTNAVRNEEQGTTRFRLAVTPDGKVRECTVTSSSGSSALDATTCRLMKQRARFTPAKDNSGRATGDTYASAIRWVLPSD